MYRRQCACLLPLVVLSVLAAAGVAGGQTNVSEASFSYEAPKGWYVRPVPVSRFKMASIKMRVGFSPNMNFYMTQFAGSIDAYADRQEKAEATMLSRFTKISRAGFVTSAGLRAVRFVGTHYIGDLKLRSVFYVFRVKGGNIVMATCTTFARDGAKYDALWDKSMKTFVAK